MRNRGSCRALRAAGWLLAAGTVALPGCRPAGPEEGVNDTAAEQPAVNLPAVPLAAEPMDREALLLAVVRAASAAVAGADDRADQRELDGDPFEFRIRFGCRGPSDELRGELLGWAYQADKGTLRLRAMPTISADDPVAAQVDGDDVEAIEGFWVPRPWLLQAACPAAPGPEPATQAAAAEEPAGEREIQPSLRWPKVGIAQFFTSIDARTRRRDMRAYESVTRLEAGQRAPTQGFDLVLSGRLRAVPGKRIINCVLAAADSPPDCIVSADIDEVRMENPQDGSVLARWSS